MSLAVQIDRNGGPEVMQLLYVANRGEFRPKLEQWLAAGDVVICAPVVVREAEEQRKQMFAHFAHMTIHAALHLQGYEHDNDADAAHMETLESALMLKLRYSDPY